MFLFAVSLLCLTLVTANGVDVTIQQLRDEMTLLTQRLDVAEAKNVHLEQQVNSLKRHAERRQIAFLEEYGFTAEISHHLTHLGNQHTVVFDNVISNIGNAYDPITGFFIAPVAGTYLFFTNIMSENDGHSESHIETEIVTGNGTQLAVLFSGANSAYDSTSNMAIVRLNRGDHVWVRVHGSYSNNFSIHCCFSSFSGYLLKSIEEHGEIIG